MSYGYRRDINVKDDAICPDDKVSAVIHNTTAWLTGDSRPSSPGPDADRGRMLK